MTDTTVSSERRKEQRKRPLGLVYVELSSANGGMLRDLSEKGFAMRAMMPLRPGDCSPFRFSLDPETRVEGECRVSWVQEDGRVGGLEFTSITKELTQTVHAWLRENSFVAPQPSAPLKPPAKEATTLQELREELRSITPNAYTAQRAKKKPEAARVDGVPQLEIPRIQSKAQEVAPAARIEPEAIKPETVKIEEPVKAVSESAPLPLPELESLPDLSEIPVLPDTVSINRGLARSGISLAIRMMIVLALIACAVVYHRPLGNAVIWLGQKITGSDAPEISYSPKSHESIPPQTAAPVSPANTFPSIPATSNDVPAGSDSTDKTAAASPATPKKSVQVPPVVENTSPQPAQNPPAATPPAPVLTNRTTTYSAPVASALDPAGQQEYLAAQDILKNKNARSSFPEAVRLLWAAVEKGNSNAEVALAELYRTGHGVTKSCDQTEILLTAAAKKGNLDAQKRIEEFLKEGCE
jgi:hypothetical protein